MLHNFQGVLVELLLFFNNLWLWIHQKKDSTQS